MEYSHKPVLLAECMNALRPAPGKRIVDGTAGLGGHAEALLQAGADVICIDKDGEACRYQRERLAPFGNRVTYVQEDFRHIRSVLASLGVDKVDGVLLDLGVSSLQLDKAERGFSYRNNAPLDMRMDESAALSAAEIVNHWPVEELKRIFYTYGEERYAPLIAAALVSHRPIAATGDLCRVILGALPAKARREERHPARRIFQALRIAVNDELGAVEEGVEAGLARLSVGGRMAVISFHSLEDRIVKRIFARWATGCVCPPAFPACVCGRKPAVRLLGKKRPGKDELSQNPRAQSACLRIAERLPGEQEDKGSDGHG